MVIAMRYLPLLMADSAAAQIDSVETRQPLLDFRRDSEALT